MILLLITILTLACSSMLVCFILYVVSHDKKDMANIYLSSVKVFSGVSIILVILLLLTINNILKN